MNPTMTSQDGANTPTSTAKTFGERWQEMFLRLVRFKEKHGHCLVPNRYPEDKKLGAWVSAQRRHYKILTSGKKESTPMTLERAQKLIDIGFDWSTSDPRHVSWDDRFEQLRQFQATYGHVQVPMGWSENSSLSNWVSAQRQDYKLYNKGRPSRLDQDKINRLDQIGFIWEAQRGGRRRKLEPLSEMKGIPLPASPGGSTDGKTISSGGDDATAPRLQQTVSEAMRAAALRRHQQNPALMGPGGPGGNNAALMAGTTSLSHQQALLASRAGVNPLLEPHQQLLNPLQNRQLLSQFCGNPAAAAAAAANAAGSAAAMGGLAPGGFLTGPTPLNADVLFRLQQQERAAFAASMAARESFMGVVPQSTMSGLPLGATAAPAAAMLGHHHHHPHHHLSGIHQAAMLPSSIRPRDQALLLGSTNSSSSNASGRERKRMNGGPPMDPPDNEPPVSKRARTED